jgi:hypothetical protein
MLYELEAAIFIPVSWKRQTFFVFTCSQPSSRSVHALMNVAKKTSICEHWHIVSLADKTRAAALG